MSVRTFWIVGKNGKRLFVPGNSMHNADDPTPEFDSAEKARKSVDELSSFYKGELKVYRCEVFEEPNQ